MLKHFKCQEDNLLSVLCFLSFMTALHVAAERAHNDILEVLQKHGAKVCLFLCFTFPFRSARCKMVLGNVIWEDQKVCVAET